MRLLGSGLASAFALLLLFAACENPAAPGPEPSVPTYTVRFDSDGGTPIADKKVRKGTVLNLRSIKYEEGEYRYEYQPEKPGYFFDGWYLQGDTARKSRSSVTVDGNITLVAKWIKFCSVSLEMGEGGTLGLNANLSVLPGTLFEAGAYTAFRKGFLFLYWYLKDDPLKEKVTNIRVDSDITLVAEWKEGWAVTLVLDGGVYPRDYITVDKDVGTLALAGIKPVKENYVLEGWYSNAGFTDPVPDVITVTDNNTTLYVKWVPLSLFEPLLGVWTGPAGTYFLYFEESRLYGFYFSLDEIRSFVWTAKILDGKDYSSAFRTLTVGTGEDADTFTPVTEKRKPAGNARLSGMWVKGDLGQIDLPEDPDGGIWKGDDDGHIYLPKDPEDNNWIYNFSEGIWLCLNTDGSGYVRANGGTVNISYVVTAGISLSLLRRNVDQNGALIEGEMLLRIPLDEEGKPSGFEALGLRAF
jgi:uncharacterized repeat protein (TIGR02543 family)